MRNKKTFWGAWLWLTSIQYFVVQLVVASQMTEPFSLRFNTISDLGNTACAEYGGRFVCSPWHDGMNVSFILLGLAQLAGALLLMKTLGITRATKIALYMSVIAGFGTILVGLFPENTVAVLHVLGAGLPFLFGNITLLLFGLSNVLPNTLRIFSLTASVIAFIGLGMFLTGHDFGLGYGLTERITAYAQTLWMIVIAVYYLKRRA